jgi:hypothetical protein
MKLIGMRLIRFKPGTRVLGLELGGPARSLDLYWPEARPALFKDSHKKTDIAGLKAVSVVDRSSRGSIKFGL